MLLILLLELSQQVVHWSSFIFLLILFFIILLFFINPHLRICSLALERKREREIERMNEREHSSVPSHTQPDRGLNPQPRYVP